MAKYKKVGKIDVYERQKDNGGCFGIIAVIIIILIIASQCKS